MRIKILPIVFLVLFTVMCGDDSPTQDVVKKKGNIVITVDSTPLLMTWNYYVKLWYCTSRITVSETGGVAVNITEASMAFIWHNQEYEKQDIGGGRLGAYQSLTLQLEVGTKYNYESAKFVVIGRDDNGHNVQETKIYDLHYVGVN